MNNKICQKALKKLSILSTAIIIVISFFLYLKEEDNKI